MLLPSVISASPAPGGVEQPRPHRLTKSAIVVVKDSESDIEDPIVKQESKASVPRGRVPARRTSALRSGPVRFFCPFGFEPRPDRFFIFQKSTKNRTGPYRTGSLQFILVTEPVLTG